MHRARPRPPAPETAPQVNALPLKRRRGHARSLASLAVSAVTGAHAASRSRDLSLNTSRVAALLGAPMQTQGEGICQAYDDESVLAATISER